MTPDDHHFMEVLSMSRVKPLGRMLLLEVFVEGGFESFERSTRDMGKRLGVSARSVNRIRRALINSGHLCAFTERAKQRENGQFTPNKWALGWRFMKEMEA